MKVIEDTPLRLKLKHFPLSEWWWGGAAIVLSLGFLTYLIGFQSIAARFTCDRPTPAQTNCDLKHYSTLRQINHFRIFDPQGTEIVAHIGNKGNRSYEIWITSPLTKLSFLPGGSGSLSENQAIADQINDYIHTPQTRSLWVYQQEKAAFLFILGSLVGVGIGISMTLTPIVTCNFYKRMDKVIIERRCWNGKNTLVEEHLSNILTAEVEERQVKNGKEHRIMLVLASAERLPIHKDSTSEKDARKTTYLIQKFLHAKA
ncbi:MAG: hypothetical protein DCF22_19510 [Leptolyngbya sp.]|nr:MAG: hypothetical protein DCF22_19510 [Leptolyngbya sp.]